MEKAQALRKFKELEDRKAAQALDPEEKRLHEQVVRELMTAHGVTFQCVETGENCDPRNPPANCTCRPA